MTACELCCGSLTRHIALLACLAFGLAAQDVTYVANNGFLLEHGGGRVLIDAIFDAGAAPYLSPSQEALARLAEAREPSLLLVTHFHPDHFNAKLVAAHLRKNTGCSLVAHTQVIDRLRKEEGFSQIRNRVHEIKLEPGLRKRITVAGVVIDALCLAHKPYLIDGRDAQAHVRNLAFIVNMGGIRFLHMGDATVENSAAHLSVYPFDKAPVDVLFAEYLDRSEATQQFIARKIKPSRIIAMHVPLAELEEESKKIREVYPHAAIFRRSMERRSLPIEVDFHNLSGDYFGQPLPAATPQVFARGIVSTDANEHSVPSFSPDGNEVFWWANRPPGPDNKAWSSMSMTMRRENGRWSAPRVTPFGQMVTFSPDGRQAYFGSQDDIWVVEKHAANWDKPRCLALKARFPEIGKIYMPSVTRTGTLYFIGHAPGMRGNMGIYRAELIDGEYARPQLLPPNINLPPSLAWAPFIAPDESYLLFSSNRPGSLDRSGDIFISHRQADGSWADPVSLGEPVNTRRQEVFPGVSPDGKYLFFARDTPGRENDIYWVSTASVPALRASHKDGMR